MRKTGFIVIVSLFLTKLLFAQSEKANIIKTCENYIYGWYGANPERMEMALHEDLSKTGIIRDKNGVKKMVKANKSQMVYYAGEIEAEKLKDEELVKTIEVLEVYKDIASVKIISKDFVDYLQLVKMGEEWQIIQVLWEPN